MKQSTFKKILEVAVWIVAEILLNWLGLDDLADYGEYLFSSQVFVASNPAILMDCSRANGNCRDRPVSQEWVGVRFPECLFGIQKHGSLTNV